MGKEYRIGCPEEEKDNLRASADLLIEKLNEIKDQGSVIGSERIAIMAALNISHDLLHSHEIANEQDELHDRIDALSERISDSMRNIQLI